MSSAFLFSSYVGQKSFAKLLLFSNAVLIKIHYNVNMKVFIKWFLTLIVHALWTFYNICILSISILIEYWKMAAPRINISPNIMMCLLILPLFTLCWTSTNVSSFSQKLTLVCAFIKFYVTISLNKNTV